MQIFLVFIFFLPMWLFAQSDLCDVIDIPNCRGITKQFRRNTFQTAPTSSTASNLNPSNVRFDKGLGIEAIAQAKNKTAYGLTSGTGKLGGAFISGSMDNTFFGNRIPELDEMVIDRYENDKQFQNQKLTFAAGARLFSNKKFGLDAGVILKRHEAIKDINSGLGVSARFGPFHLGASVFKDDYRIEKIDKEDSFTVKTFTGGVRVKNLAFDIATIRSEIDYYKSIHDKETRITIYSASFYYGDFLLNAALREESSGFRPYDGDGKLKTQEYKSAPFYGVQYSIGKHLIIGVMYNYFLLEEFSGSVALFI